MRLSWAIDDKYKQVTFMWERQGAGGMVKRPVPFVEDPGSSTSTS